MILHNLIIEDESNYNFDPLFDVGSNVSHLKRRSSFENYFQRTTQIENELVNYQMLVNFHFLVNDHVGLLDIEFP
jgi:hypothetical protein